MIILLIFFLLTKTVNAQVNLEPYCKDGYYKIPNENVCSRAPNCGGKSYDEVSNLPMPNPQECMGDDATRNQKGCAGYVPLCCYEMARKGNFTYCVGYWERLWCSLDLCQQARNNGASKADCGGNCQCGHAFEFWCDPSKTGFAYKNAVPLEIRLGLNLPQPTNTPIIPKKTSTPLPTYTPFLPPTIPFSPISKPFPSPTSIPSPTSKTTQSKPFNFYQPVETPTLPIYLTPILKEKNYLRLPPIKINYNKNKIEKEAGKFLDFFSFLFYTIKNLDQNLENKINQVFFRLIRFDLTK